MKKGSVIKIDQPILSLSELVEKHLQQSNKWDKLKLELKTLEQDMLQNDKLLFDQVNGVKGKSIDLENYNVRIEKTSERKPGKTTYKYKEILETIEENYLLDSKWLLRVKNKYSTVSKSQILHHASLIITKLKTEEK